MHSERYVYHGSNIRKEVAEPSLHRRTRRVDRNRTVVFEDVSFHATPYKWIALVYTHTPKTFSINGRKARYKVGVDLYKETGIVDIYGVGSLEESLKALYGSGGYVLTFRNGPFYHCEGLGHLERITRKKVKPIAIDQIENPVYKLKKRKIVFNFIDLRLPENSEYINYETGHGPKLRYREPPYKS